MLRNLLIIIQLLLVFNLFAQDSISNSKTEINPNKKYTPAHVVLYLDTLFIINGNLGPFTPADRAEALISKIKELSRETELSENDFEIIDVENLVLITFKNRVIYSIGSKDTLNTDRSRHEYAKSHRKIIVNSVMELRNQSSVENWPIRIGLAVLWLAGFIFIIFLINRLFKWLHDKIYTYEKKLKRKRVNFLRYIAPKGPEYFSTFLLRIGKIIVILIFLFAYLPWIFTLFPVTRRIVQQFYIYIKDPLLAIFTGFYNFLPNLFFIIVILFVARYFIRVISLLSREVENEKIKLKGFHKDWAKPTLNIFKIIIYVFALIFMFPYIPGSNSAAFQGVSIFLGVLFSLGSTSAIANIVAGVVITYMRPFVVGDRVQVGSTIGDVMEKSLLVTRIRTLKNVDVTIPNATIINNHLWNYSKNAKDIGLILHTTVTIGYDVTAETVNKLLIKAAGNTKLLQKDPKPFVLQKLLGDYSIEYEINVYTKEAAKMNLIYSDLNSNILSVFNEAGVEILSPKYVASRDGNASTIPDLNPPETKNPLEKIIDKVTGKKEAE